MTRTRRGGAAAPAGLRHAAVAAVLALGLAGCGLTTAPWGLDLGDYQDAPRDLIGVTSFAASHAVRLGPGGAISEAERGRLGAFLRDLAYNRPESLRVVAHGGASPGQERAVTTALVAYGVDPEHIVWAPHGHRHGGGPAARGTVVLAVERAIAMAPDCPGFMGHPAAPDDNLAAPNLGCANVFNFAAMVGDPHHLRQGASSIYYLGERGAADVAAYRADKVKRLPPINQGFIVGGTGAGAGGGGGGGQ
jgi:type IV pilus biogenesis protein CpaD/CtpE